MSKQRVRWSEQEITTLKRMVLAGRSDSEIATKLGRSRNQVSVKLCHLRLTDPEVAQSQRKRGRKFGYRMSERPAKPKIARPPKPKPPAKPKRYLIPAMPDSLLPEVRALMRKLTDQQIGEKFGYQAEAVLKFRKAHKLMKPKGGYSSQRWQMPGGATTGCEPVLEEVYQDEQGRTIRRFAPGWALNARPQRSVGGRE